MNQGRTPAHWIKHNLSTRLPRRHVVLDTEAHRQPTRDGERQTFRLAVAAFDHQRKAGEDWQPTQLERFRSPAALWDWIDGCTEKGRRLIVVAHNLAYDLRIADAFNHLPRLGYRIDMIRLDGGSAWCSWRSEDRTICCVDTVSWFGTSLDRIAATLGMTRPALPADADDDETWFERCTADVRVLQRAWREVLTWIEDDDLGNWKPTGAGQGWAAFRHRHMTHRILHHGIPKVAAAEREAAWAGRCEAWRWGRLPTGQWSEWDFTAAYAHVCRDRALPTKLVGHLGPARATRALGSSNDGEALLRCRITTAMPTAPARGPHGICWPVGSWEAWLWDIEARQVIAHGGRVEVLEGWRYETTPALAQWARWCLGVLEQNPRGVEGLRRLVVKGWSRTVVGRFGSRWSSWSDEGEAHGADVALRVLDGPAMPAPRRMMMVGGRAIVEGESRDAEDGNVAVMSFVMAVCRVNLWGAMTVAGFGNLAYVDTDSVLVNDAGSARLEAAGIDGLRVKSAWHGVEVYGPRQLVLRGQLRAAGIPRSAVPVGPRSWSATIWRSLPASLRQGEADAVVLRDRQFTLHGTDHRRQHLSGGVTAPYSLPGGLAVDLAI